MCNSLISRLVLICDINIYGCISRRKCTLQTLQNNKANEASVSEGQLAFLAEMCATFPGFCIIQTCTKAQTPALRASLYLYSQAAMSPTVCRAQGQRSLSLSESACWLFKPSSGLCCCSQSLLRYPAFGSPFYTCIDLLSFPIAYHNCLYPCLDKDGPTVAR